MSEAAIIQNSVGIGGRSKVIAEAIKILSTKYDQIVVHTLSDQSDGNKFLSHYDINGINVDVISHNGRSIPGTNYQQIFLNYIVRNDLGGYDLIFNSNNCLRFLPASQNYIHYIHFPLPMIMEKDSKYNQLKYRLAVLPLNMILSASTPTIKGEILANSNFTSEYVNKSYDLESVKTCYPPSIDTVNFNGFSGSGVVSLGSFHPNKRQLYQLKIASRYQHSEFNIIGAVSSKKYFNKCKDYIDKNGIKNVNLHPDATDEEVQDLLEQSRVFLHTMERECFGISIVESLNHGCIPVVPNSGGQREIVLDPIFRYENLNQCITAIDTALSGDFSLSFSVRDHLEQFTISSFKSEIAKLI